MRERMENTGLLYRAYPRACFQSSQDENTNIVAMLGATNLCDKPECNNTKLNSVL
jgi:hypothetical protein